MYVFFLVAVRGQQYSEDCQELSAAKTPDFGQLSTPVQRCCGGDCYLPPRHQVTTCSDLACEQLLTRCSNTIRLFTHTVSKWLWTFFHRTKATPKQLICSCVRFSQSLLSFWVKSVSTTSENPNLRTSKIVSDQVFVFWRKKVRWKPLTMCSYIAFLGMYWLQIVLKITKML